MTGRRNVNPATTDDFKNQSAVQAAKNKPFKSYIKTILGKVQVMTLNHRQEVTSVILHGNPRAAYKESSIVDVWSEVEDKFFRANNKYHFEMGHLIPFQRDEFNVQSEEEIYNSLSDDELLEYLNSPYGTLLSVLEKFTSPAPVSRMIALAEEAEKTEKVIVPIRRKLEELQRKEFNFEIPNEVLIEK